MKIEKDFDTFRSIVLDEEKRKVLFKGPSGCMNYIFRQVLGMIL